MKPSLFVNTLGASQLWRRLLLVCWLLLALVGCAPTKLLPPGQNLLNEIELKGVDKADAERMQTLYQQQPNSRFPIPKLLIYQLGTNFYDSTKVRRKLNEDLERYNQLIAEARPDSVEVAKLTQKRERRNRRFQQKLEKGNSIMRIGEPPVLYDTALTRQTVTQLDIFLKSKGFFRSSVYATDTVEDRRVTVTYHVHEGLPFHYTQLNYTIPDTAVERRVLASRPQSLLHVGDQYDEEVIGQERTRLETLLKNAGYYDFREQYITLEADTSFAPTTVRLRTFVADPAPGQSHRLYTIERVSFISDAGIVRFGVARDTIVRDSVKFLAYEHKIRPRILDNKLEVRPGDHYSLANTLLTQRQLGTLDMFRFNTVNYRRLPRQSNTLADSVQGQLAAIVNASPAKKFQETTEFGGTYVSGLVGPFANVRLRVRNPFGGAEVLEFGIRSGFEGQYNIASTDDETSGNPDAVLTTQIGGNVNLVIPQFIIPFRPQRYLVQYNPRTRINASYTFVSRPQYTRTNAEATYDYIWQRSEFHQYVFTPADLSIVNTPFNSIDPAFLANLQELSNQGFPLIQSFTRQLVPSINFTSLYNSNDFNETRDARYLRLYAEVGGLTRKIYQTVFPDLNVFNFARFSADYRRYIKLDSKSYFVYRFNVGAARALTPTTYYPPGSDEQQTGLIIPYDKFVFAGGSSSVRAWAPRRLGPGSFSTLINGKQNLAQEQPGELLLEGNVEYRFPLYSFINGAVFTDFGNVWLLHADVSRIEKNPDYKNAQFAFNRFYKEFAVGSGFGLRFDFTFLILRLDIATKVYDPTYPGNRWVIRNFGFGARQTAFNLGIGYPF
ncbi:BamA/TamA family outer membrane protein [Hymenobacter sp. NBH84]|uniref:translocation and assembly module lipoprotein TamL n=1 Tax=Hymenobacter sp. NBH84 TaxID=2596915 RepID=UPI00162A8FB9|nr:BamA/TamA family outer membrane protein [Hymenobacter sp. NBH84]QNE39416.1 BamA/TamA family outer membrane protein [Hymenobacter sp. NBH84]